MGIEETNFPMFLSAKSLEKVSASVLVETTSSCLGVNGKATRLSSVSCLLVPSKALTEVRLMVNRRSKLLRHSGGDLLTHGLQRTCGGICSGASLGNKGVGTRIFDLEVTEASNWD